MRKRNERETDLRYPAPIPSAITPNPTPTSSRIGDFGLEPFAALVCVPGESPGEGKEASGGRGWLTRRRRARGGAAERMEGSLATVGPDVDEAAQRFTARLASPWARLNAPPSGSNAPELRPLIGPSALACGQWSSSKPRAGAWELAGGR